ADDAVAKRLAKLRTMPMDLSNLERSMRQMIPPAEAATSPRLQIWTRWARPLRAVAAGIILVAAILILMLTTSGGPVVASTTDMAKFHDDLVSGRVPVTRVDSVQAANATLASEWAASPQVPDIPNEHVMACCMRSVRNKRMACVLLKGEGEPVTMTVANASEMKPPASPVVSRDGVQYHVEAVGDLNMIMTERHGRWVCLVGKVPSGRLIDLAASLQF
ncbi:MAG TPA: hypothetical protein VLI90_04280, partial [Tepidisphaeraceae bacterium]|nr:hypothetical protein [Tepidisphaeraceae bacterium]